MRKTLYTYSLPRSFRGLKIPLPVQSTYLRTYADAHDFIFTLPRVEWVQKCVFIELYGLLFDAHVHHICMTSVLMLPTTDIFIADLARCRVRDFHFPLENFILTPQELSDYLLEYKKMCNYCAPSPFKGGLF